ncbi:MAG: hypothetical protein H7836_17725, partial [Magnetococcus sp. YQC-3]
MSINPIIIAPSGVPSSTPNNDDDDFVEFLIPRKKFGNLFYNLLAEPQSIEKRIECIFDIDKDWLLGLY